MTRGGIELRDRFFWSSDHWEDGWTYGDWRQYVARRPDGALQPCRKSSLPTFIFWIGLALVVVSIQAVAVMAWTDQLERLIWSRVIGLALVGSAFIALGALRNRLMVAVGPRSYDGWRQL